MLNVLRFVTWVSCLLIFVVAQKIHHLEQSSSANWLRKSGIHVRNGLSCNQNETIILANSHVSFEFDCAEQGFGLIAIKDVQRGNYNMLIQPPSDQFPSPNLWNAEYVDKAGFEYVRVLAVRDRFTLLVFAVHSLSPIMMRLPLQGPLICRGSRRVLPKYFVCNGRESHSQWQQETISWLTFWSLLH